MNSTKVDSSLNWYFLKQRTLWTILENSQCLLGQFKNHRLTYVSLPVQNVINLRNLNETSYYQLLIQLVDPSDIAMKFEILNALTTIPGS